MSVRDSGGAPSGGDKIAPKRSDEKRRAAAIGNRAGDNPDHSSTRGAILCGLAFTTYWSWTFFVLIMKVLPQRHSESVFEDSWFWSTLAHISALCMFAALARLYAPFASRRDIKILAPLACLMGYAAIWYSSVASAGSLGSLILGAVMTGVGNACLLVSWAEMYAALYRDDRQRVVLSLAILAHLVLVYLLLLLVPSPLLQLLLLTFPVITISAIHLGSRERGAAREEMREADTKYSSHFALFCLAYALPLGYFQMRLTPGVGGAVLSWLRVLPPALLLIAAVVVVDGLLAWRFRTSILSRTIVSASIAGLLLLTLINRGDGFAGALIYASQQFMAILFYALFASLAAGGQAHPAKTFAIGVIFIDTGYIIGQLVGEISLVLLGGHVVELTLGVVYFVALAGFFLLPRVTEAFSSRQLGPSGTEGARHGEGALTNTRKQVECVAQRHSLTPREEDILRHLMTGRSVPAIARETFLSQNTVKTHISHIYHKLGVHSRDALIAYVEGLDCS